MFPHGNKRYSPLPKHSLSKQQRSWGALSHPVGMTHLDLTLKMTGAEPKGISVVNRSIHEVTGQRRPYGF
jgi:hypothetical protein